MSIATLPAQEIVNALRLFGLKIIDKKILFLLLIEEIFSNIN